MNVFTYGSLMFDEVWRRVVTGRYRHAEAVLDAHRRHAVRGATYPGVVPAPGRQVRGVVHLDVLPDDVARLDAFEGTPYERRAVLVDVSGEMLPASVYVMRDPACLEPVDWDAASFARTGMHEFIATYCAQRGL